MPGKVQKKLLFVWMFLITITAQSQLLQGKVINEKSEPVVKANIHLLNTNEGTITDADGNYSLQNVSTGKYTIVVSAIGYADQNKDVMVKSSGAVLDFQLHNSLVRLDAVSYTHLRAHETGRNLVC